jgi:putative transposase
LAEPLPVREIQRRREAEIIRLVEPSPLFVWRTLAQLGIPRYTFYLWYECYPERGAETLEDCQLPPRR